MLLGMKLGLGPGDFVLDGDSIPLPKKGAEPLQIFGPYLSGSNDWMDQDGTRHGTAFILLCDIKYLMFVFTLLI